MMVRENHSRENHRMSKRYVTSIFIVLLFIAISAQGPAVAWLLPEPAKTDPSYKVTLDLTIGLIAQIQEIVGSWQNAEKSQDNLQLPSSEPLRGISKQFLNLSQDTSVTVHINVPDNLADYVRTSAGRLNIPVPTTNSEAYSIFSIEIGKLANELDKAREMKLGPSSSTDPVKREQFERLVAQMFRLVAIGNYLAVLLQLPT